MVMWTRVLLCLVLCGLVRAKRSLTATSLVTCMENSQISANSFDVVFDPDDRSLHYTLDLVTEIDGYVYADIDVYAYGFKIITKSIDFCDLDWKQFCPIYPGDVQIDSVEYISEEYVSEIPGIAYQVPDIDAYARLKIYNNQSDYLACIQVFFTNGKTVSQIGVKWATAVVAGLGLLLSAVLSTYGNSTAASHISANTMSLFLYFQSVVVVAMQHVHYVPPIAAAWSENLAWSMGLIRINFMQKIFRWYVQSTGGTPTLYLTSTTISVLTQRSLDYLQRRAENILYGNSNTLIFRGIKRLAYRINIENTSVVCTGFTFFVLCGYVLAGFIMVVKYCIELSIRLGWLKHTTGSGRFHGFRANWRIILKGSLLRYIYIGFTQLTILSFWEFTERDSAAVIVLACLFLILSVGLMLWASYRTVFFARKSIELHNNPAALLYGDSKILNKYGFFYTMFNARHYWWNIVILSYIFSKALFIGFAQASGKTQALALFIFDLFYFAAIIRYQPYLDRPTNLVNIFISTVTLVNSFLFMFFSDLFGQPYTVSAIMGWIFFIMNAAFSFILLLMILAFTGLIVFSKNPDLRFKPAKDDRTSFQRYTDSKDSDGIYTSKSAANELLALGDVARDHKENWEYDLANGAAIKVNSNEVNEKENVFANPSSEGALGSDKSLDNNKNSFADRVKRTLSLKKKKKKSLFLKKSPHNNNLSQLSSSGNNTDEGFSQNDASSSINMQRGNSTSPVRKIFGKQQQQHTRQQSDSQNRLISSSYDDDDDYKRVVEPSILEGGSNSNPSSSFFNPVNHSNSMLIERDSSLNSVPDVNNATHRTDLF